MQFFLKMLPLPPPVRIPVPTGTWNVGQTLRGSRFSGAVFLQYSSWLSLNRSTLFE